MISSALWGCTTIITFLLQMQDRFDDRREGQVKSRNTEKQLHVSVLSNASDFWIAKYGYTRYGTEWMRPITRVDVFYNTVDTYRRTSHVNECLLCYAGTISYLHGVRIIRITCWKWFAKRCYTSCWMLSLAEDLESSLGNEFVQFTWHLSSRQR